MSAPTFPQPVAWRWVPSLAFGVYVLTDNKAQALEAQAHGFSVEPLYTRPTQAQPT